MNSEENHSNGIRIAVDGYSSTGKSTLARELAQRLAYRYIDTGAMYRAVTFWALQKGYISSDKVDEANLVESLKQLRLNFQSSEQGEPHIYLNDRDIEKEIREAAVANKVSIVAKISAVRRFLVEQQQAIAQEGGVVMDGRDIASVVIPDAELKIFMTADPEIRTERRFEELKSKGQLLSKEEVRKNLEERDYLDTSRADSPLIQVADARVLDNSALSRAKQLEMALAWAKERGA